MRSTGTVPTHPSGPVGAPVPLPGRDLGVSTLAAVHQFHGISISFMELASVSWNMVSFMEYGQFHGNLYILRYSHGRMTGMTTRRALYGRLYTVLGTTRLKARKVSASKYHWFPGPRI